MKCNCNQSCIEKKDELLRTVKKKYQPCSDCNKKILKKSIPLRNQLIIEQLDKNTQKCPKCGKRHIDIVMAHALKILMEEKQLPSSSSIRKTGTPLITPAAYQEYMPYLSEKTLVLIISNVNKKTAQRMTDEIPEIKAIIKGNIQNTIGIMDEKTDKHEYELLSGCDIRCDIQNTDVGEIAIYKNQSKIHIEYPKKESPKITQLKQVLEGYDSPAVIDAMCGPGTLGIYAIKKNAKKVLFNDINEHSIDALKTNLKINEINENKYGITNKNLLELEKTIHEKYDIALIDAFPGINTSEYTESLKKISKEVIII